MIAENECSTIKTSKWSKLKFNKCGLDLSQRSRLLSVFVVPLGGIRHKNHVCQLMYHCSNTNRLSLPSTDQKKTH